MESHEETGASVINRNEQGTKQDRLETETKCISEKNYLDVASI